MQAEVLSHDPTFQARVAAMILPAETVYTAFPPLICSQENTRHFISLARLSLYERARV